MLGRGPAAPSLVFRNLTGRPGTSPLQTSRLAFARIRSPTPLATASAAPTRSLSLAAVSASQTEHRSAPRGSPARRLFM